MLSYVASVVLNKSVLNKSISDASGIAQMIKYS